MHEGEFGLSRFGSESTINVIRKAGPDANLCVKVEILQRTQSDDCGDCISPILNVLGREKPVAENVYQELRSEHGLLLWGKPKILIYRNEQAAQRVKRRRNEARQRRRISAGWVGVQVINQAKTGQYAQSHYCARRLAIEITVWV
jgi:hypothetical protein